MEKRQRSMEWRCSECLLNSVRVFEWCCLLSEWCCLLSEHRNASLQNNTSVSQLHKTNNAFIEPSTTLTSWQTHRQTCRNDPSSWCADHGPSGSSSGGDHGWHYTITLEGKNDRIFFRRLRSSRRLAWRLLDTICLNFPVSTSFCLLRNHWGMLY